IEILQHRDVEHRLGQQLLQLAVLVFERLQLARIRHVHPAELRLPFEEGRAADAMLAEQIGRLHPGLVLAQNPNDLLFRKPRTLHRPSPSRGRTLLKYGGSSGAQVTGGVTRRDAGPAWADRMRGTSYRSGFALVRIRAEEGSANGAHLRHSVGRANQGGEANVLSDGARWCALAGCFRARDRGGFWPCYWEHTFRRRPKARLIFGRRRRLLPAASGALWLAMPDLPAPTNQDTRWKFLRDVAVFEMKLALNNLHNFFQIPLTLAVAVFDLVVRGKAEGERFYKLVEMGRTIDDAIDIYSVVAHREPKMNKDFTVDAVIGKLEAVILREYEKGGTTASVKQAVDKALDEMQTRTEAGAAKAAEAAKAAAEKLKQTMQKMNGEAP